MFESPPILFLTVSFSSRGTCTLSTPPHQEAAQSLSGILVLHTIHDRQWFSFAHVVQRKTQD